MKKTMTKRLLALVLALTLCAVMMLPALAVVPPPNGGCNHVGKVYMYDTYTYSQIDSNTHHGVHHHYWYNCTICGRYPDSDYYEERHTVPCSTCGQYFRV